MIKKSCLLLLMTFTASFLFQAPSVYAITTIRYYSRDGADSDIAKQYVALFQKKHPDIKVKVENNPDYNSYITKLLTMTAAGLAPDVVFLPTMDYPYFSSRKLINNLTPMVRKDKEFTEKDYFDAAIDPYKVEGKLYGLPNDIARQAMQYNKKLLSQVGLASPTDNWNLETMAEMAKKLKRDTNGDGKTDVFGIDSVQLNWQLFIFQYGGLLFDNPKKPKKCTLDSPEALNAIKFVNDLVNKYKVSGDGNSFIQGKAGFRIAGAWNLPQSRHDIRNFDWDLVALPHGKRPGNRGDGSVWAIPSGSRHVEAAWKFIKFVAGQDGQEYNTKLGWITPVYKKVANSPIFLKPEGGPNNMKAFLADMDNSYVSVLHPNYQKMKSVWETAMYNVWSNKKDVPGSMADAVKSIQILLK